MRAFSNQFDRRASRPMASSTKLISKGFGIALFAFAAWFGKAEATTITVTTTPDFQSDNLGATGSFFLAVYSQQFQSLNPVSPPIGPNATQSITSVLGGTPGTTAPVAGPSIIVSTGVIGQNQLQMMYGGNAKPSERTVAYGPTITVPSTTNPRTKQVLPPQKSSLTRAGDNVIITSTSGMYSAQAKAFVSSAGVRGISAATSITGTPPPSGQAAARAIDPFEVPSGYAYGYDPTVTATIELDSAGLAGGFAAFAADTSTFTTDDLDNFADDGSPLDQTLWYLSVGGDTPTKSAGSVLVDFELNPIALNEISFSPIFLASLGTYTDAVSESALIDQAIDEYITSQLVLNGNEVDLDNISLFPDDTTFEAIDGGVEYANAVDAVVSSVQEPASLAMLAVGLLLLGASGTLRYAHRR